MLALYNTITEQKADSCRAERIEVANRVSRSERRLDLMNKLRRQTDLKPDNRHNETKEKQAKSASGTDERGTRDNEEGQSYNLYGSRNVECVGGETQIKTYILEIL